MHTLAELMARYPRHGHVQWIGLRPGRGMPMDEPEQAMAEPGQGLLGDRFQGRAAAKRQVTLLQAEHVPVLAALAGKPDLHAHHLRRNLLIAGLNLLALKDRRFRIGEAELEYTGLCHPCSKMETLLGEGGYNQMRGHGGITARVLQGGCIRLGDPVVVSVEAAS